MFHAHTIVQRSEEHTITSEIGQEIALFHVESGRYYGLDDVSSEIWKNIAEPISVRDLILRLCTIFNVDAEKCEQEVCMFLEKLKKNDLLN